MNIDKINTLFSDGTFHELYKAGFLSDKIFLYREVYLWVNAQLLVRQISKNKVMLEAEIKFKISERTVKRALKSFSGGGALF